MGLSVKVYPVYVFDDYLFFNSAYSTSNQNMGVSYVIRAGLFINGLINELKFIYEPKLLN